MKIRFRTFLTIFVLGVLFFPWMFSLGSPSHPNSLKLYFLGIFLWDVPWAVYSLMLTILFERFCGGKPALSFLLATALALVIVAGLLHEQKGCDSICLGLEQKMFGVLPIYAVLFIFMSLVGLVPAWTAKKES